MRISAVVITLNEEKNLARCLASVADWVSEIVVVDSGSTDSTIKIAKKFGSKIYTRKFDNYADQKNFADSKASCEWILSLDADEEVTEELAREVKISIETLDCNGFLIPRRNIIFGKEIKYTRWSPDKHVWLFKKSKGSWLGGVHEEIRIDGKVCVLKNAKIHYSHPTVFDFFSMLNSYTDLEAKRKIQNGEHFSLFKMFFDPLKSFIGRFVYKKGFLDGWRGFVLSYLMGIYRMVTWIKIWEKQKGN
ncbi:MAG TPA: glycosyltransferase family 2 protein [Patescibacteria group bacterium]